MALSTLTVLGKQHHHPSAGLFSSSQTEPLYLLNNNSLLSVSLFPGTSIPLSVCDIDYCRYLIQVESHGICPFNCVLTFTSPIWTQGFKFTQRSFSVQKSLSKASDSTFYTRPCQESGPLLWEEKLPTRFQVSDQNSVSDTRLNPLVKSSVRPNSSESSRLGMTRGLELGMDSRWSPWESPPHIHFI